jgi:GNAT superfamily N-acetyltransferase
MKANAILRPAIEKDLPNIWSILQKAILRRKAEGSNQWQDGYPNPSVIQNDLDNLWAFVLEEQGIILGYAAIIYAGEPAYDEIDGQWLSNQAYAVVHRVAICEQAVGKGWGNFIFEKIEELVLQNQIFSIKVDTNFDNYAMLKILEKRAFSYCGKVYFRGSERWAFEKLLAE